MTLQDFLAASQGDERLAWARFILYLENRPHLAEEQTTVQWWIELTEDFITRLLPNQLYIADAVLAELARQREASEKEIERLENIIESDQRSNDSIVSDFDKMRDGLQELLDRYKP